MMSMMRSRNRPIASLLLLFALVAAACSVEELLPLPDCVQGESGVIVAQSVPSAELLPCFNGIPDGWERSTINIDDDGTLIRFDSDRAGSDAAILRFTAECDVSGAVPVPSGERRAERFDFIEQVSPRFVASNHYVFSGGCLSWEFDFDEGTPAALSIELADRMTFFSRQSFNEIMAETFIDAEV